MIYNLFDLYILCDLGKEMHVTDLKNGIAFKRLKTQSDHELIKQAQKIM